LDALEMSLLVARGIGVALLGLTIVGRGGLNQLPQPAPIGSFVEFGTSLLQYTAVVFVLEEVFFRGALDSYLHEGESDMLSAVFVSALWASGTSP
jgi:membrane protease YdiL (CAAX protease family)